ncbi:Integrator complex subunit 9 [Apophysomyces ossiformis]|uniref:Integrator complex subunit 9 n=1 Tax=Apophysomyces ossiformis TaxID=679940 RepID=A0A8H7EV71_9FUNG|nr:Integrator complex subunit 9 [Apophysomyces ossiformis]
MRIRCIDHQAPQPKTFVVELEEHSVLLNCPLETFVLNPTRAVPETPVDHANSSDDLASILADVGSLNKSADSTAGLASTSESINYEDRCVFRIPSFELVDLNSIDAILISNSESMLGLPFLTEYMGYKGKIFATTPTVEFARQRMEELVIYHRRLGSYVPPRSKAEFSQRLNNTSTSGTWRSIYTMSDIASCIEKVRKVRYAEILSLRSNMQLVARSSGYSLGSTNWVLETHFKKIVLMSSSSLQNIHPAPLDTTVFDRADVILVSDLKRERFDHPTLYNDNMKKLLITTVRALREKHSVIFPISSMGIVFDLINELKQYFASMEATMGWNLQNVPFYVVSPTGERSLKYANICGDWMNPHLEELIYIATMPLSHGELLEQKTLRVLDTPAWQSTNNTPLQEPFVAFAGNHDNTDKGPTAWLLSQWGHSPGNVAIYTDIHMPRTMAARTLRGKKIQFMHFPLETRTGLWDTLSLLQTHWLSTGDLSRHLVVPKHTNLSELMEECKQKANVYIYEDDTPVDIDLHQQWRTVALSEQMATLIRPRPLLGGQGMFAPVNALLNTYDNVLELRPNVSVPSHESLPLIMEPMNVEKLVEILCKLGIPLSSITAGKTESGGAVLTFVVNGESSSVLLDGTVQVRTSDEKMRLLLRDALLSH